MSSGSTTWASSPLLMNEVKMSSATFVASCANPNDSSFFFTLYLKYLASLCSASKEKESMPYFSFSTFRHIVVSSLYPGVGRKNLYLNLLLTEGLLVRKSSSPFVSPDMMTMGSSSQWSISTKSLSSGFTWLEYLSGKSFWTLSKNSIPPLAFFTLSSQESTNLW